MNKRICLVLTLMSLCTAGITGLQFYWNYQQYQTLHSNFRHDSNEALKAAVEKENNIRIDVIVNEFRKWLSDTSIVRISCTLEPVRRVTVFHVEDVHPYPGRAKGFSMSLVDFNRKLDHITPGARAFFISHFSQNTVAKDLRKGLVYNYSQQLGIRLNNAFFQSKVNWPMLQKLLSKELQNRGITASFVLNPAKAMPYQTNVVNVNLRQPYQFTAATAGFENLDYYFLNRMRWIIITTLLLLSITLFCFAYTARTLLSQHQLAKLKADFVHNMTHELNTPITAIRITTEALRTFAKDPVIRQDYLSIIDHQAAQLQELAAQLLDAERIEAQKPAFTLVSVNDIVKEAVNKMQVQIEASGTSVQLHLPRQPLSIKGDADALTRSLGNLLDNALKYCVGKPAIHISVSALKGWVSLEIADNGVGIPAIYRNQVFDRFFRVPQGDEHNVKGYGLGLSYVKQIVNWHKGTIGVAENPGGGTIFIIKLPAHG